MDLWLQHLYDNRARLWGQEPATCATCAPPDWAPLRERRRGRAQLRVPNSSSASSRTPHGQRASPRPRSLTRAGGLRFQDPLVNEDYIEGLFSPVTYQAAGYLSVLYVLVVCIPEAYWDLVEHWRHAPWAFVIPTLAEHCTRAAAVLWAAVSGVTRPPPYVYVDAGAKVLVALILVQGLAWLVLIFVGCVQVGDRANVPHACVTLAERGQLPLAWMRDMLLEALAIHLLLFEPLAPTVAGAIRAGVLLAMAVLVLPGAAALEFARFSAALCVVQVAFFLQASRYPGMFARDMERGVALEDSLRRDRGLVLQTSRELREPLKAWEDLLHVVESAPEFASAPEALHMVNDRTQIIQALRASLESQRMVVDNALMYGAMLGPDPGPGGRPPSLDDDADTDWGHVRDGKPSATSVHELFVLARGIAPWLPGSEAALEIRFEISPDVPNQILVQRTLVWGCLMNLLSNARKFTKAGSIVVTARVPVPGCLRIEVADTGVGVLPENRGLLFTPLTRFNSDASGLGLGLACVRAAARELGGDAGYEPRIGVSTGSTFWFEVLFGIPESAEQASDIAAAARGGAGEKGGKREASPDSSAVSRHVVLVDDDPVTLMLLEHLFQEMFKCRVSAYESAEIALEDLCGALPTWHSVSIVFADVRMPCMDGVDFVHRIRDWEAKDPRRTPLPIILFTGAAQHEVAGRAMQAGATKVLEKPASRVAMWETVLQYSRRPCL